MSDSPPWTLQATITGDDRPGVSSALFAAIAQVGAEVIDLEQVVVRGHLTLSVILGPGSGTGPALDREADRERLSRALTAVGAELGMPIEVRPGGGDTARRRGRAAVVLLGAPLLASAVAVVTARIAAHDANIDRIRRLSRYPVTTVELDLSGADVTTLRRELALESAARGFDVAVSPGGLARRGRRLVVLDVDSTLIQDEVIELLAAHAGHEQEVADVTAAAMRGELDFAESLRARVATLAGLPTSVISAVRGEVRLTPGARTLVRTLHRLGFTVALVSGGFEEVVRPLADDLGIRHVRANRLEVAGGALTGRLVGPVVDRRAKAEALRDFAAAEGLPLSRTVAVGDGANDLDMLAAAGLGVAFNAKPVVREQADAAVNVPFLDPVLHLLGISREEIEEADGVDAPSPTGEAPPPAVPGLLG